MIKASVNLTKLKFSIHGLKPICNISALSFTLMVNTASDWYRKQILIIVDLEIAFVKCVDSDKYKNINFYNVSF